MPIQLPDGTTLPETVPYVPLPAAVTSIVANGTVTSTRAPLSGEPAADANYFDDTFQAIVAVLNGLLSAYGSIGVRVYNSVTSHWDSWPLYVSTIDPASLPNPPSGDYVWLNTSGSGPGGSGISIDTDGVPYF